MFTQVVPVVMVGLHQINLILNDLESGRIDKKSFSIE